METFSKYNYTVDTGFNFILTNFLTGKTIVYGNTAYRDFKESYINGFIREEDKEILDECGVYAENLRQKEKDLHELKRQVIDNKDVLHITIMITEQCNFRCKYCCEEFVRGAMQDVTLEKIVSFVEDNIQRFKFLQIEWFGGEPTLEINKIEKYSAKLIEICKSNHVGYGANITTNGYLLTKNNVERLLKQRVFGYQITLDGIRKTHDKQRVLVDGRGTWDVILSNLREIRDGIKTRLFNVMIRVNITWDIYENRIEILSFLKEEFNNDSRFHFLWKLAEDWGNIKDENRHMLCGTDEYIQFYRDAARMGLKSRFLRHTLRMGGRMCEASKKNTVVIFADGIIGKCERNLSPEVSHICDIDQMLLNPKEVLGVHLSGDYEKCEGCEKESLCLGLSCPLAEKKECGYEMNNLNSIMELIAETDDTCIRINK